MSVVQVLSPKTSIQVVGNEVEFRKRTYRGRRIVRVPKQLVLWSIENKALLAIAVPRRDSIFSFDTPIPDWKVQKSLFIHDEQVYISYTKLEGNERVG